MSIHPAGLALRASTPTATSYLRVHAPLASIRRMASFEAHGVRLYYEEHGAGFPVLLFAPGGMRSSVEFWKRAPWNPLLELTSRFRVIALDQRNAGRSQAPLSPDDGWHVYTADHLALLDHLGIEQCHVLGGCIGGSFCLGLMQSAPGRIRAAVLQQPIGSSPTNRDVFYALFDGWADELKRQTPGLDLDALRPFRERMYGGDFVFNVSREFVRGCQIPMLVLMGNDVYHPSETSREIVQLAPHAELIESWKTPEVLPAAVVRVREFLLRHTPA